MASNKTTFKGFTFKRAGTFTSGSTPVSLGTTPSTSRQAGTSLPNRQTSEKNVSSSRQSGSDNFQTSITSFTSKNKQVAVAAVIPQRPSPSTAHAFKTEPSLPGISSYEPLEILDDDDDDFEPFPFSQKSPSYAQGQSRSSEQPLQKFNELEDLFDSDIIEESPQKPKKVSVTHKRPGSCDNILHQAKKQCTRTHPIIDSDDGKVTRDGLSSGGKLSNEQLQSLIKKDSSATSTNELIKLQEMRLQVLEEICDIFCKVRTCDLMNLPVSDYERLQNLLTIRKQMKDKWSNPGKPVKERKDSHRSSPTSKTSSGSSRKNGVKARDSMGFEKNSSPSSSLSSRKSDIKARDGLGLEKNISPSSSQSSRKSDIKARDGLGLEKNISPSSSQSSRKSDIKARDGLGLEKNISPSSTLSSEPSRKSGVKARDSLGLKKNISPSSMLSSRKGGVNAKDSLEFEKNISPSLMPFPGKSGVKARDSLEFEKNTSPSLMPFPGKSGVKARGSLEFEKNISLSSTPSARKSGVNARDSLEFENTMSGNLSPENKVRTSSYSFVSKYDSPVSYGGTFESSTLSSQPHGVLSSCDKRIKQSGSDFNTPLSQHGPGSMDQSANFKDRRSSLKKDMAVDSSQSNCTNVSNNNVRPVRNVFEDMHCEVSSPSLYPNDTDLDLSQSIDERDYADEMEVAMSFDNDCKVDSKAVIEKKNSRSSGMNNTNHDSDNSPVFKGKLDQFVLPNSKYVSKDLTSGEKEFHKQCVSQTIDKAEDYIEDEDYEEFNDSMMQKEQKNSDEGYTPVFSTSDHDDGATSEFAGMKFDHSEILQNMFRQVFGLKEFRHNQLQAINAALLGHDCFVLMPTGGGKSLCYQLPALITEGVSVIVSPLRALIQDQTQRLLSLDIPAAHLSGDVDAGQSQSIYSGLHQRNPAFKLLYVTPEKLSASEKLLSCLDNLYGRQKLNRFVIDEAHCVSQWGHDFRPDYKRLNVLRQKFPGVPTMALTATATPRVRKDIIHQLGMCKPKWFMQSFNRPNLKYSVQNKKPSNSTADVIEIIKKRFPKDSGIVYCLSRKECDTLAKELKKAGIPAEAYHAGLTDNVRANIQERWLNDDRCNVICATIAFGMGIDKADVRFVIHHSLPKSVEGYYQEAGRAGRDGQLSQCILLYTYQDVKRLRRMIELDQNANFESKRVHNDNLFRMVGYCENVTDCRRSQILQYFGEYSFNSSICGSFQRALCDNCLVKDSYSVRDVTADAKEIVKCVRELNTGRSGNYTLIHIMEIFKGSQNTKIQSCGHAKLALHSRGKDWARCDAERLCRKLVIDGILKEDLQITAHEHAVCYVRLGSRAVDLMQGKIKVELPIQGGRRKIDALKVGTGPQNDREKVEMECLTELRAMAKTIAMEHGVKNYALIFPESALKQLAQRTPITRDEMIEQIDHFNATIVDKYQAHRLLDITLKYSMELAALNDDEPEDTGNDQGSPSDQWASHYFEESFSSAGRSGGRGGRRRGKGGFFKSRGKGRKYSGKGKTTKKKTGLPMAAKSSSLNQFQYKKDTSFYGGASGATGHKPSKLTKAALGMMPDPRSRSTYAKARGGIAF